MIPLSRKQSWRWKLLGLNLKERTQRAKANATAKASDAGEKERKKEEAHQRKNEQEEQEEQARHEARQRKKEQEEQARQRKKEQEEQARHSNSKARGKYKTFDDRMEDLKRFEETHGHANVSIPEDKSLAQFCANAGTRIKSRKGFGKFQFESSDREASHGQETTAAVRLT
jgi:hypothetical protein